MAKEEFTGFMRDYGFGDSRGLGTRIFHYKNGKIVNVEFKPDNEKL